MRVSAMHELQVASFIFGENIPSQGQDSEKIAMTTPVVTEMKRGQKGDKIAMTSPVTTEMSDGRSIARTKLTTEQSLGCMARKACGMFHVQPG